MYELIAQPSYLIAAASAGLLAGALMTHQNGDVSEVGAFLLFAGAIVIVTMPYSTDAHWPFYLTLFGVSWVCGMLLAHEVADRRAERRQRLQEARAAAEKKKPDGEDGDGDGWSVV